MYATSFSKKWIQEHTEYREGFEKLDSDYRNWITRYGKPVLGNLREDECEDEDIIEQVKCVSLDLLRVLQEVSEKHGLHMYLIYGSLLGAVREGGLIRGDDDVDVAFSREDYNKLMTLVDEFPEPYFLQTMENDNCFFGGYSKLRNKNTTAINPQNWWVNCCEGIFIDIFPMDYGFAEPKKEKRKRNKIKHLQRILYAKAYGFYRDFEDMPLLIWKAYKYFGKLQSRKFWANKLSEAFADCDDIPTSETPFGIYTHYMGNGSPRLFSPEAFEKSIRMEYENLSIEAPADWDRVLFDLYGENYLQPVGNVGKKLRHGFYNSEVPYTKYRKRFKGLMKPIPDDKRKILLVGDKALMDRFVEQYPIIKNRSNTIFMSPEEVVNMKNNRGQIDFGEYYPVICSFNPREVESQLREIGFREYYFFWLKRNWMLMANASMSKYEIEK